MYCKDHLFIEWLVSSCCRAVILIGCLNFMSFLSKDVGCSSLAKSDKLLTEFTSICFCLWQSHCWARSPMAICPNPDHSLCSQKTVKFIFLLQLHHSWVASLYPKALDTLSHSTKQSKRRAYWPTNPWLWVFTIQELAPLSNCFPFLSDLSRSSKLFLSPLQLPVQPSLLSWAPSWNTKIQTLLPLQEVLPLLWPKLWGL